MNFARSMSAVFVSAVAASVSMASSLPYDSHGFEPSAGYVTGDLGDSVPPKPPTNVQPGVAASEKWSSVFSNSALSSSSIKVAADGSGQYVALQQTLSPSGDFALAYPTALAASPISPGSSTIAVTWTMTNGTTTSGNVFFGVTALNGNGETVAAAGINSATGMPFGLATVSDPNFRALNGAFVYQLLLNYGPNVASESFTLSEKAVNDVDFKLIGSGKFESGTTETTFGGAALSAVALDNATQSTASASIDNFSITVPEPASLAVLGMGAMTFVRRRRA